MSRGCPVVSYDIRYGPREQITDGVDGFLVAPGDVDTLAARVIDLLGSPETARRMGDAAMVSARRFGPEEFVRRWAAVLQATVDQKPDRTRIRDAELQSAGAPTTRPARCRRGAASSWRASCAWTPAAAARRSTRRTSSWRRSRTRAGR
jgi:poly(glycerol-phosphate) alpha-glucosyltransferase